MKRLIFYLLITISSVSLSYAQMSDNQIIEYVKSETNKGTSQEAIGRELLKRGVTPAQIEKIKSKVEQQKSNNSSSTNKTTTSTLRSIPYETEKDDNELNLKENLSDSLKLNPKRQIFGKNIFNQKNLTFIPNLNIPTPENYSLGPGDEVVIDIWGASQASIREIISPEGSIVVDRLGPIYLNGMTVKEANSYVQQKFASLYQGLDNDGGTSQVRLTLGQIRTIQISIMGEVAVPGTYAISSLSSVFHALYMSGGLSDIGSLRSIQLYRKNKLVTTIDIYKYLLKGKSNDVRLMDGDVIIVNPYISLVNIAGKVKRPMYYEMVLHETLADLIEYSGGFTGDAYQDKINIVRKTGVYNKVFTIEPQDFSKFILNDEDSITVSQGLNLYENRIEIQGSVYRPGYYELGKDLKTVKDLINKAGGVRQNAFLDRAILTREKEDLSLETMPINLKSLFNENTNDIELRKNDILFVASDSILFSRGEFSIFGDVIYPGSYQYADNTTVEDLIIKAGGLLNSASMAKVDISRRAIDPTRTKSQQSIAETFSFSIKDGLIADGNADFILRPYDQVFIRRSPGYVEQQNILLEGEVLFPGTYSLNEKNERLSNVIKRAGSLTSHAYPQGAKLIRKRSLEEMEQQKQSLEMVARGGLNDSISSNLLNISETYTVGIELDKAVNNPKSEYDLVLRDGDRLVIPEFDNTVKINGAVMHPNTVLYKQNEKVSHYINQAGGFNDLAEKKNIYIVYMNGTISKVKASSKNVIAPGCEIIVPSKDKKQKMSLAEKISIGTSITSMASVIALLINSLAK